VKWLSVALFAACQANGPLMTPGEDCLSCHSSGRNKFTVAGTIYSRVDALADEGRAGVDVVITDASGATLTLTTNEAGNFYADAPLTFPITAELHDGATVRHMQPNMSTGSCASCHQALPEKGAEGRLFIAP
jgi:phosphatidate phosphatase APP1